MCVTLGWSRVTKQDGVIVNKDVVVKVPEVGVPRMVTVEHVWRLIILGDTRVIDICDSVTRVSHLRVTRTRALFKDTQH